MRWRILLLLLPATIVHAEIYKCVKDGSTSVQDKPCVAGSKTTKLVAKGADSAGGIDWSILKSGMSVDEVRKSIPGLKEGTGGRLVTGATAQLRSESAIIEGVAFEAKFFFLAGRFTRVNYLGSMSDNDACMRDFENISVAYRSKYGKESKREVKQKSWGVSADAEWNAENGKVTLGIMPVTGGTSRLLTGFVPK